MKEALRQILDQFSKGKATQGMVCVGDLNQILSAFQELTSAQIVLFDSNPEKVLEFMLEQYNQPLPQEKNNLNSSVYLKQGNIANKNIAKEFFKAFKTNKTDLDKVIVLSGLDEYIEVFPDLFIVLNAIIKDLKGKKVRLFLALQFKKNSSYERVQQAFEKLEKIEFDNLFNSKIVQSTKKQAPQTLESNQDEIPKEKITVNTDFKNKVLKAKSLFEEPQLGRNVAEPEKLDKSINLFKSYVMELQAEAESEQSPNMNLINKLESLYEILINAQPLLLKNLVDPLDVLLQNYTKRDSNKIRN